MVCLGLFYQKIQETIDAKKVDMIPQIIANYTVLIEDGSMGQGLANIPTQYSIQLKLVKELADQRYVEGVNNKRYNECVLQCLLGIYYTDQSKVEDTESIWILKCQMPCWTAAVCRLALAFFCFYQEIVRL